MSFTPAIAEQRFVLEHAAGLSESVTPDLVDAVLKGAGIIAAGEWAPLDRLGDTIGAKWTPGGRGDARGLSSPTRPMSRRMGHDRLA